MPMVTINGVDITITVHNKPVSNYHISLYPKSAHGGMTADKLDDLFDHAVSKLQNNYDLLDLNIDNTNILKDTYNSEITIRLTHNNNENYDQHDLFIFVKLHQDPNEPQNHESLNRLSISHHIRSYQEYYMVYDHTMGSSPYILPSESQANT